VPEVQDNEPNLDRYSRGTRDDRTLGCMCVMGSHVRESFRHHCSARMHPVGQTYIRCQILGGGLTR
jgi:hypothetical protein